MKRSGQEIPLPLLELFEAFDLKIETLNSLFYHSVVLRALLEEHEFRLKLIAFTSARLYDHLLSRFPMIVRQVPSRYIAEFMGITPEWLAKLKSRSLKS